MENFEKNKEDDEIYELKKIDKVQLPQASDEEEKYFNHEQPFNTVENVTEDIYLDKVFDKPIFKDELVNKIGADIDKKYLENFEKDSTRISKLEELKRQYKQNKFEIFNLETKLKSMPTSFEKTNVEIELKDRKISLENLEIGIKKFEEEIPLDLRGQDDEVESFNFSQN